MTQMSDDELYIAWLRFEVECEEYDRTLSGAWSKWGRWEPLPLFMADRLAHAQKARRRLGLMVTGRDHIRKQALRVSYEEAKAYLASILKQTPQAAEAEYLGYEFEPIKGK